MTETALKSTAQTRAAKKEKLTNARLDGLLRTRPHQQYVVWDTKEAGFHVLVSRGSKQGKQSTVTFRVAYYLKGKPGSPKYMKLGRYPDGGTITRIKDEKKVAYSCANLDEMRDLARELRNMAKNGQDPRREPASGGSFADEVKRYLERPVDKKKNKQISLPETERIFNRYVLPEWGEKQVEAIVKQDVSNLLGKIANNKIKGPNGRMIGTFNVARATRIQLSAFFNWYVAERADDRFRSPVVRNKTWAQGEGRERVLSHDEIRALWKATAKVPVVYGAVVRMALLTMQRFHKVSRMLNADLKEKVRVEGHTDESGQWTPTFEVADVWDPTRDDDPFNKAPSMVPLSSLARKTLDELPEIDGENPQGFVFTLKGEGSLQGWSKFKKNLDDLMKEELKAKGIEFKPWQHRDLRRTARTIMSRAGVASDIAEHAMGHKPPKIQRTYDRHEYLLEKQHAFKRLADHIDMIVNGQSSDGGKVVPFPQPGTA